jgi:hypothetical protein
MVLGLFAGSYYSLAYSVNSVDSRVSRYGYPADHASATREAAKRRRSS